MPGKKERERWMLNLEVEGPRAVALALKELKRRHGLVVSYEDPVYIADGTYTFEGQLKRPSAPGLHKRVRVPITTKIGIGYEVDISGVPIDPEAIAKGLLEISNAHRRVGRLAVGRLGSNLIIVGEPKIPIQRPLDCELVVERRWWNGDELLKHIARLVSNQTGVEVYLGMAPANLLARRIRFQGRGEARAVLLAALTRMMGENGHAGYHALYDRMLGWFLINVETANLPGVGPVSCPNAQVPSGEKSVDKGQDDNNYKVLFEVHLRPGGGQFTGKEVKEFPGTVCDGCYYPGCACAEFSPRDGDWHVQSDDTLDAFDFVGVDCRCRELYMKHRTKCSIKAEQIMTIESNGRWCIYTTNKLFVDVSPGGVVVTRETNVNTKKHPFAPINCP